jgi:hypothetical protein
MEPLTLKLFPSVDAAMLYRYENGSGGWIFAPDVRPENPHFTAQYCVILFDIGFTPSRIFKHPIVSGLSGRLIS